MRLWLPALALAGLLFSGCTRTTLKDRKEALRPVSAPQVLADDLGMDDLRSTLERHADFLSKQPNSSLRFGERVISASDYAQALLGLAQIATAQGGDAFREAIRRDFEFLEVYGNRRWGEVLLTSYFEPVIDGSAVPTEVFSAPLLSRPSDLIEVAASKYDDRFSEVANVRGRLIRDPSRQRDILVPYYTRAEIQAGALKSRHLELCWVHPVDAFFMEIQGSGTVVLPSRKLRLRYSDQNGHLYHSIGKFLTDLIPLENMTLYSLESYLKNIPADRRDQVLSRNPSFIFFEKGEGAPRTSFGNEVFPGRTIAADARFFPKGALGFLNFKKPVFDSPTAVVPSSWEETSRFVIDHDSGGAIRGGGRIDLFWGSGNEAKRSAGFIKDTARLYYLVPKTAPPLR